MFLFLNRQQQIYTFSFSRKIKRRASFKNCLFFGIKRWRNKDTGQTQSLLSRGRERSSLSDSLPFLRSQAAPKQPSCVSSYTSKARLSAVLHSRLTRPTTQCVWMPQSPIPCSHPSRALIRPVQSHVQYLPWLGEIRCVRIVSLLPVPGKQKKNNPKETPH